MKITSLEQFIKESCQQLHIVEHTLVVSHVLAIKTGARINAAVNERQQILVTPAFVSELTPKEQCAVLSHEFGHIYHKHVAVRMGINAGSFAAGVLVWFLPMTLAHKLLVMLGLNVLQIGACMALYRHQELQADQMARRAGLHHELQSALRKIYAEAPKRGAFLSALQGYPTMDARLAALE